MCTVGCTTGRKAERGPRAYGGFLPVLALLTLASAVLSWLSVVRFMAGRQD